MTQIAQFPKRTEPRVKTGPKPRRWSHQDELQALVGKQVNLTYTAGSNFFTREGLLVAADQFTLKIRDERGDERVYFKSAMINFARVA